MKVTLVVLAMAWLSSQVGPAQAPPKTVSDALSLLSPAERATATKFLDKSLSEQTRLDLLEDLVEAGPSTAAFLVRALAVESSPAIRAAIIGGVKFTATAEAAPAVAERAQTDPSPQVREIARAKIQWEQFAGLRRGARQLRELAAASRAVGAPVTALETEAVHRESVNLDAVGLPLPPPVFSATEASPVRVVVLGDFGTSDTGPKDSQERVAQLMADFHKVAPFTFGISVGDNFYTTGIGDAKDARWDRDWEGPYAKLGIPFWVVAGNHDWDGTLIAIKAEIARTEISPSKTWKMPATYYTFTAGPLQFFALDTDDMHQHEKDDVLTWLQKEAATAKGPWRIAFGHHPVLSGGAGHGAARLGGEQEEIRTLRETVLLPVLEKTVDVYVAGHDHELQLLQLTKMIQVISGGGGRESDKVKKLPESLFCAKAFGFAVLEATADTLTISFARLGDKPGKFSYSCILKKKPDGTVTQSCQTQCPI